MPESDSDLAARPVDIQELLADPAKQYVTPDFQRDFDWGEEQFDELLSDILTAADRDEPHFLGQIIVVERARNNLTEIQIIDGQQRITTIIILACVLRDIYKETSDQPDEDFENQVSQLDRIIHCLTRDGESRRRLKLENNEQSDDALERITQENTNNIEGNVGGCYDFYSSRLSNHSIERINNIRQTILNKLHLIRTSTGDLNSAYQVFQTQNDRGLDLSVIDLAKSITFEAAATTSDVDSDYIKDKWLQIVSSLDEVSGPGAKRPITHILGLSNYKCPMSAYPNTFIKRYKKIIRSELNKNEENIADFIEFVDREAATYFEANAPAVGVANSSLGRKYDQRAKQFRYKNPHAGVALYYLYKKYRNNEDVLYRILDLLIILNVRLNLNDATQAAKRDPIYSTVSRMIKKEDPVESVKRSIREETPSDSALKEFIITRDFKRNNITRLVLRELEVDHFNNTKIRFDDFQIEHIAPRKAFSKEKYTSWRSNFDHDEGRFEQFSERIGNLTLLEGKPNARAGANPFGDKKGNYNTSNFAMTKQLCEYDDWSYSQIEERSKELSKLIVDTWSIE